MDWLWSLKEQFPNLFRLILLSDTALFSNTGQDGWNFNFRRHLNDWEMARLANFFESLGITCYLWPLPWQTTSHVKLFSLLKFL